MLTKEEFVRIGLNDPNFRIAREIILKYGVDFKIYSCNQEIIKMIISNKDKSDELQKILDFITEANNTSKDIMDIMREAMVKANQVDIIESFFKDFESSKNGYRLYGLVGEAGVGKTYIIEKRFPNIPQYACNSSLDPYSLCYYLADKDGKGLKPYETPFLRALKYGDNNGKVFLDEFNELPHDTKMFIQGITDKKRSVVIGDENIVIHPDFKIIASFNPPSETDERDPLGDALLSRSILFVLELTDDIISSRLKVTMNWINLIKKLHSHVKNTGLIDIRELNYRNYEKFKYGYDFESIFKAEICVGDLSNIREYKKITQTGEYQELLRQIKEEAKNNG